MARTELLMSMFDPAGCGLEVGGGYNPLMRKSAGHNVETADYNDAAALREKYSGVIKAQSDVEEVDYVLSGSSLAEAIRHRHYYDYIVGSHVIEHTTDLIAFLVDSALLLKPEGVLALAVPDKRYCFDVLQPLTSTGDLLEAHRRAATRHRSAVIFDHIAYAIRRGAAGDWKSDDFSQISFFHTLQQANDAYNADLRNSDYVDVHSWKFVPSSFRLIMRDLHEIGLISMRERDFYTGLGPEFLISMSSTARGCGVERIELAQRIIDEQASVRKD